MFAQTPLRPGWPRYWKCRQRGRGHPVETRPRAHEKLHTRTAQGPCGRPRPCLPLCRQSLLRLVLSWRQQRLWEAGAKPLHRGCLLMFRGTMNVKSDFRAKVLIWNLKSSRRSSNAQLHLRGMSLGSMALCRRTPCGRWCPAHPKQRTGLGICLGRLRSAGA